MVGYRAKVEPPDYLLRLVDTCSKLLSSERGNYPWLPGMYSEEGASRGRSTGRLAVVPGHQDTDNASIAGVYLGHQRPFRLSYLYF